MKFIILLTATLIFSSCADNDAKEPDSGNVIHHKLSAKSALEFERQDDRVLIRLISDNVVLGQGSTLIFQINDTILIRDRVIGPEEGPWGIFALEYVLKVEDLPARGELFLGWGAPYDDLPSTGLIYLRDTHELIKKVP